MMSSILRKTSLRVLLLSFFYVILAPQAKAHPGHSHQNIFSMLANHFEQTFALWSLFLISSVVGFLVLRQGLQRFFKKRHALKSG